MKQEQYLKSHLDVNFGVTEMFCPYSLVGHDNLGRPVGRLPVVLPDFLLPKPSLHLILCIYVCQAIFRAVILAGGNLKCFITMLRVQAFFMSFLRILSSYFSPLPYNLVYLLRLYIFAQEKPYFCAFIIKQIGRKSLIMCFLHWIFSKLRKYCSSLEEDWEPTQEF